MKFTWGGKRRREGKEGGENAKGEAGKRKWFLARKVNYDSTSDGTVIISNNGRNKNNYYGVNKRVSAF